MSAAASQGKSAELLVEIGCEELPPKALAGTARQFALSLHGMLGVAHLVPGLEAGGKGAASARYFCSPRRLAVLVPGVLLQQPDRLEPLTGPAEKVAFDAAGKPTKAAEGFAAKCGTTVDNLARKDGKLYFERKVAGRAVTEVVPEAVRAALDALPIAKRMRWGAGDTQFVRPVHWIVMLHGAHAIEAEVYGVKSGRATRGHRFHHPQPVALKQASDYVAALKSAKVLVNDAQHPVEAEIRRQAEAKAKAAGGTLLPQAIADDGLISEIAALCEWPVVLEGRFDPRFLELPPEVLISTIETNQRYLLLAGADGKLLPKFLFVTNIESKQPKVVVAGNERVIVPRLSDAMFFWAQDRALPLAARSAGLAKVVFQKELGSYGDKAARVGALAERIAARIGGDVAQAREAAALAKCDLLTSLVGEFPELQGTVGRHLAMREGLPEAVAAALEEQYLPRFAGDALPATKAGQALALADRLDTVCGIFAVGQKPTGDKDPFALRRAALGVMRIAIESKLDLDLKELIAAALTPAGKAADPTLNAELYAFFMDRLRAYYTDAGRRADVFAAVSARAPAKPLDFDARMKAVEAFLGLPEAAALAAANKRIANIVKQAGRFAGGAVDAALLTEPGERALHAALASNEIEWVRGLLEQGAYESALRKLAALRGPVDQFFDGVMVMAEDPKVRANRLALLVQLQALFLHTADLAQLQVEP